METYYELMDSEGHYYDECFYTKGQAFDYILEHHLHHPKLFMIEQDNKTMEVYETQIKY